MAFLMPLSERLTFTRRGLLSILVGTAGGQVLALFGAPVLARLYTPAEFGAFAVLAGLVATLGTVAACRIELAVPLPASDREAYSLVALGLIATVAVALVATVLVAAVGDDLTAAFSETQLMPWLLFVPLIAAMMGTYLVLNQLAIRQRRYGAVGRRNLLQAAMTLSTQVVYGLLAAGPAGLLFGMGLGHTAGALSLLYGAGFRQPAAKVGLRIGAMRKAALRYKRFALLLAPSGLLNVLGLQLPVLLVAYWYGGEVAGWLGLTQRVLALPVTLIGTAVSQIYLAELARAIRTDDCRARSLFRRSTRGLVASGAVIAVGILITGPFAFSLVFGNEWEESGHFARALSVALAAQLVAAPLSQTLVVLERHSVQMAWDALRLVGISVAVAVAAHQQASALSAIWALGITSALLYGISWALSWNALRRFPQDKGARR
jgi:O-antigen/teichoic acid export membrane protein